METSNVGAEEWKLTCSVVKLHIRLVQDKSRAEPHLVLALSSHKASDDPDPTDARMRSHGS
jgi:hypothetical protein